MRAKAAPRAAQAAPQALIILALAAAAKAQGNMNKERMTDRTIDMY